MDSKTIHHDPTAPAAGGPTTDRTSVQGGSFALPPPQHPQSFLSPGAHAGDRFLEILGGSCHIYDENLFYACREYVMLHDLNFKKHQRDCARDLIQKNTSNKHLPIRTWLLLRYDNPFASKSGICYFAVQTMLAVASVASLCFESAPEYNGDVFPPYRSFWPFVDLPVATLLSLDLVLYYVLLPSASPTEYSNGVCKKNFFFQTRVWIDLVSTLPTFLIFLEDVWQPLGQLGPLKVLRVLRFVRALRVLHSVDMLLHTLERSIAPLLAPLALFIGLVLFFLTAIYYAEKGDYDELSGLFLTNDCDCESSSQSALYDEFECPRRASAFISIPHAMWFIVVTITTVGYGDIVPLCSIGKFLAVVCMFLGSVVIAMPIAIVGMYYTSNVLADRAGRRHDPSQAFGRKSSADGGQSNQPSSTGGGADSGGGGAAVASLLERRNTNVATERKRLKRKERARMLLEGADCAVDGGMCDDDDDDDFSTGARGDGGGDDVDEIGDSDLALFCRPWHAPSHDERRPMSRGASSPLSRDKLCQLLGPFASHDGSPALMILDAIADTLEDPSLAYQTLSLLNPDLAMVREVNLIIQQQFRSIVQQSLTTTKQIALLRRRAIAISSTAMELQLISKPDQSHCSARTCLSSGVSFVVLSGDGAARCASRSTTTDRGPCASVVRMCAPSYSVPEVGVTPDVWLYGWLEPTKGHLWISPSGSHQRIEVNQERIPAGKYRKLLIGDVVSVMHHVKCAVDRPTTGGDFGGDEASSASHRMVGVPARFEFLRVDGGGGVPQIELAPQETELRVLPVLLMDRRHMVSPPTADEEDDGFILVEPVAANNNTMTQMHHMDGEGLRSPTTVHAPTMRASGLTFQDYQRPMDAGGVGAHSFGAFDDL